MAEKTGRVAAWGVVVVALCALAFSLVLIATTATGPGEVVSGALAALTPLISVVVGAVVVHRRGNHPVGWLFCVSGVAWTTFYLG